MRTFFMRRNRQVGRVTRLLLLMLWTTFPQLPCHAESAELASKTSQQATQGSKRTMKGQVKSESGEPLIGVTVYGADGKVSGVTDMDGMYHIDIPTSLTVVRFSYVGMNPVSITIEPGTTAVVRNLSMQSSTTIKDVVVTGIFQKNKEAFTGAVATITNKELKEFGNKNLLTSIANIDPSFNLLANNQYGSDPNRLPDVQIRGTAHLPTLTNLQDNTRTDLNTPLIILDGFEISLARMVDLNEDEVESITLLKDGSATAIYGSRGANGVIVIKRKTPQTGRLRFSYSGSLNVEVPDLSDYHLLNAADKLELERRSGYYQSTNPGRDFILKKKLTNT